MLSGDICLASALATDVELVVAIMLSIGVKPF